MKEYIAEYIVPVEKKGKDCMFDFMNTKPLIRCKDCKHWKEGTVYSYCDKLYGMGVLDVYDYMTAEDDYCSRAERKEEWTK